MLAGIGKREERLPYNVIGTGKRKERMPYNLGCIGKREERLPYNLRLNSTASLGACGRVSVTQFRFPLGGGRQGVLLRLDGTLARLLHPSGLSRVEFNVRLKLGRNVRLGVDGVHRTFIHAGHAIDALLRVNDKLTLQLIKAGHRAHHHAVGELAPHTFIGNDMRHKSILFQVHRAYGSRLDDAVRICQYVFWGNVGNGAV
jgi:hypothetical protein